MAEEINRTAIADAVGMSVAYASQIVGGKRIPPLSTALTIYDKTGYQFGLLEGASTRDINVVRRLAATMQERHGKVQ